MRNSLVCIVIVTYNTQKFIKKTLQSCLNQTYQNFEILVLDNNSEDETCKIINSFEDKRISLFKNKKNIGPYAGLNFLLDRANGEYIAIQDHDDIWFPKKLEKQIDFLEKNKDYIACGTNTFYFFEKEDLFILNKKKFNVNFVDHTSLVFRNKKCFRYNADYILADEYFEQKILAKEGQIACIQSPLNIHRIRSDGNNLSNSRFKCTKKNLKQFFEINQINIASCVYLTHLCFLKFLPNNLLWWIRKNITFRKAVVLSKDAFMKKYDNMNCIN